MAAWLGKFRCVGSDPSICELMKETSSFRIYIKIYVKGDVFLLRKVGIILIMAILAGVVAGSQMLGEQLYRQADEKQQVENGRENGGSNKAAETAGNAENTKGIVVLDSGHGGKDPGKIGINGALESEVNLKISEKIKKILQKQDITVIMTREDENGLADSKVEDLKARVTLINEKKPYIAVSIHQNSYPQEEIRGAQVFYFTHSEEGKAAAEVLQNALLEADPDNTRQAKANDTYYLLKKTEAATVIVECGFLSNKEEADKLITEEYQEQMAAAVAKGILEYISGQK